jgi:hypothetical protein
VNGEVLDNIHEEFKAILSTYDIKIHSFQEAKGVSGMKGLDSKVSRHCFAVIFNRLTRLPPIKVVDDFSSKLDLPKTQETVESIDANHMDMVRCSSKDDTRYRQISGVLKQFMRTKLSQSTGHLDHTMSQASTIRGSQTVSELPSESNVTDNRTDFKKSVQM